MEEDKYRLREEIIEVIDMIEDAYILKYFLIFIKGKIKVGR